MSYKKFSVMMLISFVVMYAIMFLNIDDVSHVYLSLTRTYMSVLMVTCMAAIMMGLMGHMYPDKKLNRVIISASAVLFVVTLFCLRTQAFVSDHQYMKGMIPHHSSAILFSKHANLQDPEVKKMSEEIIKSQEQEIAEMKAILERTK